MHLHIGPSVRKMKNTYLNFNSYSARYIGDMDRLDIRHAIAGPNETETGNFFGSKRMQRDWNDRKRILSEVGEKDRISKDYEGFGYDYFDNPDIGIGYGGYRYDGRYAMSARRIAEHYHLSPGCKILEVGCAKGYIIYEFQRLGLQVTGIDISRYAVSHAHMGVRNVVCQGDVCNLPFSNGSFDFVFGKEMLPHIEEVRLEFAVKECMRVSKGKIFFEIQCGRTDQELEIMKAWDCTHKTIQPPDWWKARLFELGYPGDTYYKVLFPLEGVE